MAIPTRTKISTAFRNLDGSAGVRSKFEDFRTLHSRVFARIRAISPALAERLLAPGIHAYNMADYGVALQHFAAALTELPALEEELRPHVHICERVTHSPLSATGSAHLRSFDRYERLPFYLKWFLTAPPLKIRCKYCGEITTYIDPNQGLAYLGTNNCEACERGYPMPDFVWDGIDGQAYIYYRNSVKERVFYSEFETQFDVEEDHTAFLKNR